MKAIWNLGFRPFFLLGALWACVHMFAWIAFQMGALELDLRDPVLWHSHEMIFGFASAIIAGFLLTASQNWTGIRGVHGSKLMILVGLWSTARVLSMVSGSFPILFAIVDLLFYPSLAWALKPYLMQPSQKRNQIFFVLFFILTLANISAHATSFGITPLIPSRSLMILSMFAIILMIGLIGGRIIPFFTSNALPNSNPIKHNWIERLSLPSIALAALGVTFWEFSTFTVALCFLAGLIHLIRWMLWKPWNSKNLPILLILYIGYTWIPIGFFLRGLSSLSMILPSISTHAFTAGAIGIMIYAMITRVALGHSGRPIRASKLIVLGYIGITVSATIRVFGPWLLPQHTLRSIELSGLMWLLAFLLFVIEYAPILLFPRMDGKEG